MSELIAILIISDTVAADESKDRTTEAIESALQVKSTGTASQKFRIEERAVVPDDKQAIANIIRAWSNEPKNYKLILASGGTGFSDKDVTPDAIEPLLERKAPGLVFAMINKSLTKTPFGIASRPAAGIRKKSLIITLPGSPTAARENIEAIVDVLPHILQQIGVDSARSLHGDSTFQTVTKEADLVNKKHSVHHHHHHHDHYHNHSHKHRDGHQPLVKHQLVHADDVPVTQRKRSSPYEMISVDQALKCILEQTPKPVTTTFSIFDPRIIHSIIAEPIYSPINVPNFRASIVDGYAVVSSDGPGTYPVVSVSHASAAQPSGLPELQSGTVARITTGAPVPPGSDAVVMVESTVLAETTPDGKEEHKVQILAKNVKPNDNIREIGSDLKKGALVLSKNEKITSVGGEIGLLASVGIDAVKVFKKPVVGVLSTGNEIVDVMKSQNLAGSSLPYGQIYDSNRPALISSLQARGFDVVDLGIATDTQDSLADSFAKAFAEKDVDYIITSGGVSMGELDLLKPTIEKYLNGTIHFGRVAMKPGKPTTFATVKASNNTSKLIFALPGNPASAIVTLHLFVYPSLYRFAGYDFNQHSFVSVKVKLNQDTKLDARPEYHRVYISQDRLTYELISESTGFQRSSRVGSLKSANGLLCLPSLIDADTLVLAKGTTVDALLIDALGR